MYIHRGIAARTFTRKFTLSDDVVVKGADFKNGLLIITMERIVPDEKKARNIPIGESVGTEKVFLSEETK
jgi:molecular chaperone IbpA